MLYISKQTNMIKLRHAFLAERTYLFKWTSGKINPSKIWVNQLEFTVHQLKKTQSSYKFNFEVKYIFSLPFGTDKNTNIGLF